MGNSFGVLLWSEDGPGVKVLTQRSGLAWIEFPAGTKERNTRAFLYYTDGQRGKGSYGH